MDSPATDPLRRLVQRIEQHLDEPLTLDRIAEQAGLSVYPLWRMFTAHMGHSAMAHLRGRRLVRGARRLCDGRFDPQKAGSVIDFHVPVQA